MVLRTTSLLVKTALIALCVLCLAIVPAGGQDPVLRQYTVSDGLPSSHVYFTFHDSKGYIWTCTDKGLAKFDGYSFETYTIKDGMLSNDVFGLVEDKLGRIWLNTFDGICYFKNGKFFNVQSPVPKGDVVFHHIDPFENHFVIFEEVLYTLKDSLLEQVAFPYLARLDSYILFEEGATTIAKENKVEIESFQGLIYVNGQFFNDQENIFYNIFKEKKLGGYLIGILKMSGDNLAVVLSNSVFLFEKGNTTKKIPVDYWDKNALITRAANFRNSNYSEEDLMWMRTTNDYFIFDSSLKPIQNNYYNFLSNYEFNTINVDGNENHWISTKSGLLFLGASASYSSSFKLGEVGNENIISSLEIDDEGIIWMGNAQGSLFRLHRGELSEIKVPELRGDLLRGIAIKGDDMIVGGSAGVHQLKRSTIMSIMDNYRSQTIKSTKSILLKGHSAGAVKSIRINDNHVFVAGSHQAVIFQKEKAYRPISPFRSYAMEADDENNIWIGHTDGLEIYKNDSLIDLRNKGNVYGVSITDLRIDKNNFLWAATGGFGLHVLKDSIFYSIKELEGEIVNSIFVDQVNHIWAATNIGAIKLTIEDYQPLKYNFRKITKAHGLPSDEVTHIRVYNDSIVVATNNGLSILSGKTIDEKYEPPLFYFKKLIVNGRDTTLLAEYDLPHWQNNIEIEYVCLSYKSNKDINYYYQLEGIDIEWRVTKNLSKDYQMLPVGEYSFKVKAEDVDGLFTEEKIIRFNILPPWWQTAWFVIFVSLFSVGIIFLFFSWRIKRVKKKADEENIVNKKFAELELKALQAQMNPHFIFNAINSIQDFIFKHDERTANRYLVKFSRLMRLFLEASKKKYVFLKDEIEMIRLYIELEKLRFGEKFQYTLNILENIEPSDIEIPSMMIQPFVENAINHGLVYKKGKGSLNITMELEGGFFKCVVEDDGVGRKKAKELKNNSYKSYISRGMQLVDERQQMLSYIENLNIDVEIIDLENEKGEGIGTKVELKIPFS